MTISICSAVASLLIVAVLITASFVAIRLHYWNKCKKRLQQIVDEMEVDA